MRSRHLIVLFAALIPAFGVTAALALHQGPEDIAGTQLARAAGPGPAIGDADQSDGSFGPGRGRAFGRKGGRFAALLQKLNLTDEQAEKIRDLNVDFRNRTREARMKAIGLMDEKRTMIQSGKPDFEKMAKLDEEIVKTRGELMRERLRMKREGLSILTPEQLNQLSLLTARRSLRSVFGGTGGRGHGRHFGR